MNARLYFVTLNWNTTALLKEMITSVEATTPEPHKWIIIDNGSNGANMVALYDWIDAQFDQTVIIGAATGKLLVNYIREACDDESSVCVIRSPVNTGCIMGHNMAFDAVNTLENGRQHEIVMIDTDVVIAEEGWLSRVLAWANRRPLVGIVGLEHGKDDVCAPAVFLDPAGYWYLHEEQMKEAQPVEGESVGLGLALIRWPVLEAGLRFDENFRMYYKQDDDLCFQVRALGMDVWTFPVGCIHYGAGSLKANDWTVGSWQGKEAVDGQMKWNNQLYFARKWAWALRPRRRTLEEEAGHLANMKQMMTERRVR